MSELFQTKTLGASWSMVHFRELQGNRESRVQFTSNAQTIYALDYTSIGGGDTRRPSRSTDGGSTWSTIPNDPTDSGAYGLWADPTSTQRLLVNDYSTIYFSSNGGTTWSTAYSNANSGSGVRVAGVFWDGADVFIGTNVGVVRSSNNGSSFAVAALTGLPAGHSIVSFAGGKTGSTRRFACATVPEMVYNGETVEEFYSVLSGASIFTLSWETSTAWQNRSSAFPSGYQIPWVGMARNDAGIIWAAGADGSEIPVVYRSTNAGTSWTSVLSAVNNTNVATGWAGQNGDRGWTYGGNPVGFSVAPTDASKAAFTDYGFCHLTTNGGSSWKQTYVNPADENSAGTLTPKGKNYRSVGLENTTCWQVLFPTASRMILCNSDIRGTKSDNSGFSWNFNYTGHTDNSMYRVIKHSNGNLYAATSSVHDLYQSTYLQDARIDGGGGKVLVSADNGNSWTTLKDFGKVVCWVAADPTDANRLYASVVHWNNGTSPQGGIWRTDNLNLGASATWTKCTAPPRTEGHPYNIVVLNDGSVVASFSARRNSGGSFTASSGVFYSTDQGATWADRSHADMQYWTKDVVIDPHDASQNTWYACVFNGWGGSANNKGGLLRTTDRGQNWTRILASDYTPSGITNVESITVHPSTPGTAWMTTEQDGLWFTSNLGSASPTWEEVSSQPFRQPTRVFFDPVDPAKIWVTSFGHGLALGSPPPGPLQAWKELYFEADSTNELIAGDEADPDGDGMKNLVEYALNTHPLSPSHSSLGPDGDNGLPVLVQNNGSWYFEFVRRKASGSPGITYYPESSVDLQSWSAFTGTPQVTTLDATWEYVSWPVIPQSPTWSCHLRLTKP